MNSNMRVISNKYCRTCLQELDDNQFVLEPRKKHPISPEIANKLISCTAMSFEPEDQFPKQLCDCCFDQLNKFYIFRQLCIASMERFRDILAAEIKHEDEDMLDVGKNGLVESEMLEVSDREINAMKNPLEIGNRILRHKRKKSHVKTKIDTCTEIRSEPTENETQKCDDRLHPKNDEVQESEKECNFEFSEKEYKRKRNIRRKVCEQQIDEDSQSKSTKVFQCELCSMRFFVEHRFIAHKRTHDGLIPYPCPRNDCVRGFERWHSLSEHLKQHEGTNRWFSCEEHDCNRRYKHKATLELHLRRYHKKGPELKSFVCEICGKVFKSSAILNDHRFTHKDKSELPFACHHPQCKYRFSNKAKLKVHLMRHAGIKKYICPHCNMRKTTQNELKIHINYHTLERRFPCRFCPQICNNAGNLKVHIRTVHERAKDYACRFCERTFAKPDTRKYHEMIHTGEKPHKCTDCGKRFVQPAALRTHKKIHLRQHTQYETPPPNITNIDEALIELSPAVKINSNSEEQFCF